MLDLQLAIGLVMILFAWNGWRKVSLDDCRDSLFDLRKSLRAKFIEKGYALNHPAYLAARKSLNAKIRLTESISFISLMIFIMRAPASHTPTFSLPACGEPDLDDWIERTQNLSNAYLLAYVVESSPLLLIFLQVSALAILAKRGIKGFEKLRLKASEALFHPILKKGDLDNMACCV